VSVTGIVLAGGRATRFGGPKLEAELDGRSLLAWAIVALSYVADEILVAGPEIPDLPALTEHLDRPRLARRPDDRHSDDVRLRIVADAEPFAGPLAALEGALVEARGDIAVVVGGDMPRLVPAVLQSMIARLMATPHVDAVLLGTPDAPHSAAGRTKPGRQVLPLVARVRPARAAARDVLAAGDRSLRAMLDRLACHEVPAATWLGIDPAGATLLDVDTEADLDRLRASRQGGDVA
jgi:molybdenum cofactor guanylyltransferase